MLTNKGKYGLKAMVHLAGLAPGALAQVQETADSNAIPKKFLDQILSELRNAGLVFSKKGKGGGYALARPADQISVGQIIRVLDGPIAPLPCVSKTAYMRCRECRDERSCGIRIVMKEVRDATAKIMDSTSLADMLKRVEAVVTGNESLSYAI